MISVASAKGIGQSRRHWLWLISAALVAGGLAYGLRLQGQSPTLNLTFSDGAGGQASLADFRGKVVLVNLWATWCAPCRQEMPALDRLQNKLGGPDFQVIALSVDRGGISAVNRFYQDVGVRNLPVFVDLLGTVLQKAEATGLPTTLLFDRNGREIGRFAGPAEWDGPRIEAILKSAIARDGGTKS
ncbi:TlpA family protein disulfide reductase [Methylobacterium nonmethylotrophicum]|uniref:TlpA family protein disulfide reductase n=1 Tax=Methylobacterium nonmethylotrophicum TaxID=1141884 RepID=A0A4Z0NEN6_9HYPH|nr:TlpA disulfide reductase family protein [Methylobacterium nonmethylotrophicum]TGD92265.1 TlpA family protein disulfide reductase [Methylobacterium nonmethylotrophicum]